METGEGRRIGKMERTQKTTLAFPQENAGTAQGLPQNPRQLSARGPKAPHTPSMFAWAGGVVKHPSICVRNLTWQ